MKYKNIINAIILLISIVFATGCNKNKLDIDVSSVSAKVELIEFHNELFQISPDSIEQNIPYLEKKYGDFFIYFTSSIINIGNTNDKNFPNYFYKFLTDPIIIDVNTKCNEEFPNLNFLKTELTDAFKHYKYYFPEKNIPICYTYISGFNQSIITADNILGIGLDKYLGQNCKFYKQLGLPNYQTYNMHKQKIIVDCMRGWAEKEYPMNDSSENLLASMIHKGKVLYFIDAMLPNHPDSLKIGYTDKQLLWGEHFEDKAWNYLIEYKLLFSTNYMEIRKFTGEAPFTAPFLNNSPPRIGEWLGWQIVKSYMENNSKITLSELMKDTNYQQILAMSKYNP